MIKQMIKDGWKHIIGMIIIVLLAGWGIYTHITAGSDVIYCLSMFAISNVLGVVLGYFVEVIQRTLRIGKASKMDMYASIVGANIGFILIVLYFIAGLF